jgi:hypothetical protein
MATSSAAYTPLPSTSAQDEDSEDFVHVSSSQTHSPSTSPPSTSAPTHQDIPSHSDYQQQQYPPSATFDNNTYGLDDDPEVEARRGLLADSRREEFGISDGGDGDDDELRGEEGEEEGTWMFVRSMIVEVRFVLLSLTMRLTNEFRPVLR